MNIDKFTVTSYDQIIGFDRATNDLIMVLDELTDFNLSQEEEKVEIAGRGGRTIASLKKNKKVTGSGTNGMLSGGALAAMLGTEIEVGESKVRFTDTVMVKNNTGETKQTAIGTVGNEIGVIYIRDEENVYISGGRKLIQTAETPNTGEFTYDPATKIITFAEGDVADGTEVIMYYDVTSNGKTIINNANKFSKTLYLIIDVTCQDACDNIFHGQFTIERGDFNGNFDIQGGSDPSVLSFEFTSLPNICTGESDLWQFHVWD